MKTGSHMKRMAALTLAAAVAASALSGCRFGFASDPDDPNAVSYTHLDVYKRQEEEGAWKRAFEDEGYQVTCVLKGLGELEEIQQIFVDHAQAAMNSLGE